ncbi:MAG: response regulator [Ignavibacteriaceae bacterium]|nr:response regulator [Ignavibacteriaceae bacterium]
MKNILIVEDDNLMRQFYSILFKKHGFETFISDDGEKIIEYLQKEPISIIVLDINLNNTYLNGKQINGLALLKIIKQIKKYENVPVVLVTAHSITQQKDFLNVTGSKDIWITKPIANYSEFVEKINSLISN